MKLMQEGEKCDEGRKQCLHESRRVWKGADRAYPDAGTELPFLEAEFPIFSAIWKRAAGRSAAGGRKK